MITKYIAIVLNDKVIGKVMVSGRSEGDCQDRAFAWADETLGFNEHYELFDLGNPRHQVLFETEIDR